MKKFVAGMLCFCMMAAVATACNTTDPSDSGAAGTPTSQNGGDDGDLMLCRIAAEKYGDRDLHAVCSFHGTFEYLHVLYTPE